MGEYIFIGGWEHGFIGGMGRNLWRDAYPIPLDLYPCVFIKLANQLENKYNIKVSAGICQSTGTTSMCAS